MFQIAESSINIVLQYSNFHCYVYDCNQADNQLLTGGHFQSFSTYSIEQLQLLGHKARVVDIYQQNFRDQLEGCDGFMWWFAHLPFPRNIGKRLLPAIEHGMNMPVFPSWKTNWRFDDKVSQYYLLQAAGIPMPETWVFWHQDQAMRFCRTAQYPMVMKLASGIISENVRLVNNFEEAIYWTNRLFGPGVVNLELPVSEKPRAVFERLSDAAHVLVSGKPSVSDQSAEVQINLRNDLQKDYFLLQEFLPKNDFDTRIAVIGNRAFGFRRFNRANDFRASGSGLRDADRSKIDLEIVRLAFQVAQKLKTQSVAIDAMLKGTERVLIEISYYYEGWILHECPGHWELNGSADTGELVWVEGQMRPEDAILRDFLTDLDNRSTNKI